MPRIYKHGTNPQVIVELNEFLKRVEKDPVLKAEYSRMKRCKVCGKPYWKHRPDDDNFCFHCYKKDFETKHQIKIT